MREGKEQNSNRFVVLNSPIFTQLNLKPLLDKRFKFE